MHYRDELAQLRRRQDADAADADRPRVPDGSTAGAAVVVQTVQVTRYPTIALAMYGCQCVEVTCEETEGAVPTFTPFGATRYVLNLGAAIPPTGTNLIGRQIDGLLIARYG